MLAQNVEIIDIAPAQYERMSGLIPPAPAQRQGLFVFTAGNALFHAVHTARGPLEGLRFRGPAHLPELARETGADYVVCLDRGALRRLTNEAQTQIRLDDPLTLQGLACYNALRGEMGAGLHIYPDPFRLVPKIPGRFMRLAQKLMVRDLLAMAVVFDDDGSVWGSLILELRDGEVAFISTTDFLEPVSLKGNATDADQLIRRLEERRGRPGLALFCDTRAFRHILHHPRPLWALQQCVRRGWVRLKPCPLRLRLLLRRAASLRTG